jgi:hypothetical protein
VIIRDIQIRFHAYSIHFQLEGNRKMTKRYLNPFLCVFDPFPPLLLAMVNANQHMHHFQ